MVKNVHLLPAPKKKQTHFPQIHRFIPAGFIKQSFIITQKMLIWLVLLSIVATNISIQQPSGNTRIRQFLSVLSSRIMQSTSSQSAGTAVLGEETEMNTAESEQKRIDNLTKQQVYWNEVIAHHPDYRDAYAALATISYQLGKPEEARRYISTALELDPNYMGLQSLLNALPTK